MFFGTRKSIVGLDLGTNSVKAVEITRDKYDYLITGFARVEVPPDSSPVDVVPELFRRGGFKTKRVVASVSGKGVIVRYVPMVRMSRDELKNAIQFEADKYIPFDIEEVALDCVPLEEEGKEAVGDMMKVLLVAVKRSQVDEMAKNLVGAGLSPLAIDVDAFAIGNAFELNEGLVPTISGEDRAIALIDIGANKTCINVVRAGTSMFTREIYSGGNAFTQAVARSFGKELLDAETLKCAPEDHQIEQIQSALTKDLEDLANEVAMSFEFFEQQNNVAVEEVFLSGGSALLPFLDVDLERRIEKKTRVWNPIEGLKVRSEGVDIDELNLWAPSLAVAVGLAARAA
ncbi:MAG: type IV pilus assembly protein PilM [Planctomycetes bacterium]|nr:type IV pilus assembly protein PilM [Planctomycetota bacterium]